MKHVNPSKLLWVDLEMTGLEPTKDRIVEIAVIVTDWDFTELASFESGVRQNEREIRKLFADNPWTAARAETQGEIERSLKSPSEQDVEAEIIKLIDAHFAEGEPVILAGNSIHCDRGFIKQWWPEVEKRLHYRMLDVSAWKVVMQSKYRLMFNKKETHQALPDIRESIAELKFYLDRSKFKVK